MKNSGQIGINPTSINSNNSTAYLNDNSSKSSQKESKIQNKNENLKEEKNIQKQIMNHSCFYLHTNERRQETFLFLIKLLLENKK